MHVRRPHLCKVGTCARKPGTYITRHARDVMQQHSHEHTQHWERVWAPLLAMLDAVPRLWQELGLLQRVRITVASRGVAAAHTALLGGGGAQWDDTA
jgi:hypothetical protein